MKFEAEALKFQRVKLGKRGKGSISSGMMRAAQPQQTPPDPHCGVIQSGAIPLGSHLGRSAR